jgi:hypothetical protein
MPKLKKTYQVGRDVSSALFMFSVYLMEVVAAVRHPWCRDLTLVYL